jgi:uncharacterized protein
VYDTRLVWAARILTVIGAVNWGLVGLFRFNLVEAIFGQTFFARLIYTLVGVAGFGLLYFGMTREREPGYHAQRTIEETFRG